MKVLVVVDMQRDFIDGALGTAEAVAILPRVSAKIERFDGLVLFTRDTHGADYFETQEGRNLPVAHCIRDTAGWEIHPALAEFLEEPPIDKETFGSTALGEALCVLDEESGVDSVELIGLCTDICVISNALLVKAFLPEVPVSVDASCCAGVTPESHRTALSAMRACQIIVEE